MVTPALARPTNQLTMVSSLKPDLLRFPLTSHLIPETTKTSKPASASKDTSASKTPGKSKRLIKKDERTTAASLASIHLDGEETESIPIYLTADDVRREIRQYLTKTGSAKAAFARELSALVVEPSSKVSTRNLDQLLKMEGPKAGAHNPAFFAADVFFEKIRFRDGKKKSKKREEMEEQWAKKGGFPREGSHNLRMFCHSSERPCINQYVHVEIRELGSGRMKCSSAD